MSNVSKSFWKFSKTEIISVVIIVLILIAISIPNFASSIVRYRDQVRSDDLLTLQKALDSYRSDAGYFPQSTSDGRMIACQDKNGPKEYDKKGNLVIKLVPCQWGIDPLTDIEKGGSKIYLDRIPEDPQGASGIHYTYLSDGQRYQLLVSFEDKDEPGYDQKVADRGVSCGERNCNVERVVNVPPYITIEEYDLQLYCQQFPKDAKCKGVHLSQ